MKSKKRQQGKINIKKVVKGILEGKKKVDIAVEAGSLAKDDNNKCNAVTQVQNTKEYKKEAKKTVDRLQTIIDRAILELETRATDTVQYKDLTGSIEKLTKLKELLTGGATERTEISTDDVKKFLKKA